MENTQNNLSPEEVTKQGEAYYLNNLKDTLEAEHSGDYLVLEAESKEYFIDKDLLVALNKARAKFPNKLFFIVQIGTLQKSIMSYKKESHGRIF